MFPINAMDLPVLHLLFLLFNAAHRLDSFHERHTPLCLPPSQIKRFGPHIQLWSWLLKQLSVKRALFVENDVSSPTDSFGI